MKKKVQVPQIMRSKKVAPTKMTRQTKSAQMIGKGKPKNQIRDAARSGGRRSMTTSKKY